MKKPSMFEKANGVRIPIQETSNANVPSTTQEPQFQPTGNAQLDAMIMMSREKDKTIERMVAKEEKEKKRKHLETMAKGMTARIKQAEEESHRFTEATGIREDGEWELEYFVED